jgi:hypothetical protein
MSRCRTHSILVVLLLSLILLLTGCGSGSSSPTTTRAPTATTIPTPASTPLPTATRAPRVPLTCTAPSTPGFPAGSYFPIDAQGNFADTQLQGPVTFNADGSLNRAGEKGCYALSQQQITFTDDFTGYFPCPQTAQTGVYTWAFDGKVLSFALVNDGCSDRIHTLTAYRWEQQP